MSLKSGDPNLVAPTNKKLQMISKPPDQTRINIHLSKDLGRPVFVIEFEPFGLTADGGAVISLFAVTAQGGSSLAAQFAKDLVSQNVKVQVAPDSVAALKTGGSYSGVLSLVERAGVTSFEIAEVKRVD
jgi:hypothetical protein